MKPDEAIEFYDQSLVDYRQAGAAVQLAREQMDEAKQTLALIEAEVIANGGWGEFSINGSNETTRKAQVTTILARHPDHQAATERHMNAVRALGRAELQRDGAAEQMRFCRTILTYETARLNFEAYAHGSNA
jgi:hypothetical protein